MHRLQRFPDLALNTMDKVVTMSIVYLIQRPQLPLGTCFGGPMWVHRLQRLPTFALNPMMLVVTMVTINVL